MNILDRVRYNILLKRSVADLDPWSAHAVSLYRFFSGERQEAEDMVRLALSFSPSSLLVWTLANIVAWKSGLEGFFEVYRKLMKSHIPKERWDYFVCGDVAWVLGKEDLMWWCYKHFDPKADFMLRRKARALAEMSQRDSLQLYKKMDEDGIPLAFSDIVLYAYLSGSGGYMVLTDYYARTGDERLLWVSRLPVSSWKDYVSFAPLIPKSPQLKADAVYISDVGLAVLIGTIYPPTVSDMTMVRKVLGVGKFLARPMRVIPVAWDSATIMEQFVAYLPPWWRVAAAAIEQWWGIRLVIYRYRPGHDTPIIMWGQPEEGVNWSLLNSLLWDGGGIWREGENRSAEE